ncbi:putative oxidoreductase [uncultured Clostridium sp.]|uniref:FAD binding domain-containing protein n=1 Tax=uncultured Clostridium sp. TaxID=59620 RepID=UPI0008219181|nr:FAD binding domain-containing protein [uncultured Clostridium sp.]SCK01916.1 putative oxidoreductase [uncultured Clostridium sp.]
MFTIKNYIVVQSLEEAYELNQKKNNVVLGGTAWLKMGERNIQNAIDLSGLGLNKIEEDDEFVKIGCMCTLREMEVSNKLNRYFDESIKESLKYIVGVQFRNCATIGGSIYSRFGFSDILTVLLALDTYVELYKGGIIPLEEYKDMPYDNDILVRVLIRKDNRKVRYLTHRNSATDIPTLACAVSKLDNEWNIILGARPQKAMKVLGVSKLLSEIPTKYEIEKVMNKIIDEVKFESNMRGSKEYRLLLAKAFIKRGIEGIVGGSYEN